MRSPSFKHPGSKAGVLALVAFAVLAPAFADGDLSVGLGGVRFYNGFIPSGLDLTLSYSGLALTEDAETILFLKAGGGYQNALLMRDPANGNPWTTNAEGVAFKTPNFQWEFAFLQGLARRDDGKNLVEAFLFYRGRYDRYLTEGLGVSAFSDIEGLLGTSFMAGLSLDSLSMSRHRALRGAYAELAGEWGPGAINAGTDFWRVSAQFRGFLPLVDLPSEGGNLFNIYAAGFAGAEIGRASCRERV